MSRFSAVLRNLVKLENDERLELTAVTYHRFLRFYPDGTVLSFLTTDQYVSLIFFAVLPESICQKSPHT